MSEKQPSAADYPIAETRPESVRGKRGRSLDDLTLEAVVAGDVTMDDMRITPDALLAQAQIARSVGRESLAANFERAAEMTGLPQEEVVRVYELLRPGRAASRAELNAVADQIERDYGARFLAAFVREAGDVYEKRGLFNVRF